jgi:predicted dehydrogenase
MTDRQDRIRIGIVGAGANTVARHIPGLQAIAGVEIVSVANRSRESGERVAAQFGIARVYDRWDELIAAPDADAIVIGTWPYLHARATVAALEADKHVLCEARMARNAAEAHRMLAAAQAAPQLVAQIVPAPFTLGVDRTVRRLIAEGFVGELLALRVRDGNAFLDRDAPLHWRQDMDLSGFNILTMGIWYESIMRWAGEATEVLAMGATFARTRALPDGSRRAVRVPEHVDIVARLACGAQASMQFSSVTGLAGPAEVWLFGSAGVLRFSEGRLSGARRDEPALREIAIPEAEAGRWRVEQEFISAIRGHEPVTHTSFEDGVKYMEFTEAVTRSIQTRQSIALPL